MPEEPRIPPEYHEEISQLYRRLAECLRESAARQLGSHEQCLAPDIVQEAFHDAALIWEQLRLRATGAQEAWLRRVVRNKIIDHWRAPGRSKTVAGDPDLEGQAAWHDTATRAINRSELEVYLKAISAMPEIQRRVAYLRWLDQWEVKEISEHLGITQSTVRVHVHNARCELRELRFEADLDDNGRRGRSQ